ncbi:MAG: M10 family metallopeptidase [Pseudomonadota bacterium]
MCTLCQATQVFDPARHTDMAAAATITEVLDAPANASTPYTLSVGDTFSGSLNVGSDRDWVAVTLTAGETYLIDLQGSPSGVGTLSDPYLYLYNASGTLIAEDDDAGVGWESSLQFTAAQTGTYYLGAASYQGRSSGTYTLTLGLDAPPAAGTLDELAAQLTNGWGRQYTWGTNADGSARELRVDLTRLTAEGQQLARWAMQTWEMVANITFLETTVNADITADDDQSGAYAYAPTAGDGELNVSTSWLNSYGTTRDSYSYLTYVHEFGHALGLYHQGDYNGSATFSQDAMFANDSWQLSVMSYFDQNENPNVKATLALPLGPQMADIVAIQNLYGAPDASSATGGDTIWGFDSTLGNHLDDAFDELEAESFQAFGAGSGAAITIYDQGGIDTINFAGTTKDLVISLLPESFSDFGDWVGAIAIARGTDIENVITGDGDDVVTGNTLGNIIQTNGGDDTVDAREGADIVIGGAGDDALSGGDGHDQLTEGLGRDTIEGDAGSDRAEAIAGVNTIYGDSASGGTEGEASDFLVGGLQSDTLYGGGGHDVMSGDNASIFFGGADVIHGQAGDDVMQGGLGADSFVFAPNDGADVIGAFDISAVTFDATLGYRATLTGADFVSGLDQVVLTGFSTLTSATVMSAITGSRDGAVFDAEGTSVTFYGVSAASLSVDDFVFA